jgi:hypothetical protein
VLWPTTVAHPMKRRFESLLQSIRLRSRGSRDGGAETILTTVEARQGFLGMPILFVLVASMALAVVSIVLIVMAAE